MPESGWRLKRAYTRAASVALSHQMQRSMQRSVQRVTRQSPRPASRPLPDHGNPSETHFAELLERCMMRLDLWDAALGRRLGIARSEVFRWRSGRVLPSARNGARLGEVLQAAAAANAEELLAD